VAAKDTNSGMTRDDRHVYGPRPVSALLPRLTRPAFRRRSPATTQVLTDWSAIVGPAIAAVTTPRRLSSGTLTIACAGPIAMELQYMTTELTARINAHLGSQVVNSLRFVQTTTLAPPVTPPPVPPDPAALALIDAAVAAMPQGELRTALAALGRAMVSRSKPSTPLTPKQ
jgi:hypothetical protein